MLFVELRRLPLNCGGLFMRQLGSEELHPDFTGSIPGFFGDARPVVCLHHILGNTASGPIISAKIILCQNQALLCGYQKPSRGNSVVLRLIFAHGIPESNCELSLRIALNGPLPNLFERRGWLDSGDFSI